jgi:hypothetical protein
MDKGVVYRRDCYHPPYRLGSASRTLVLVS